MKTVQKIVILLMFGVLFTSACATTEPATPSNPLVIEDRLIAGLYPTELSGRVPFRGQMLTFDDGFKWCVKQETLVNDRILVYADKGSLWFQRIPLATKKISFTDFKAASIGQIYEATIIQANMLGLDISKITLTNNVLTVPDAGPTVRVWLRNFGTPQRVEIIKSVAKEQLLALYDAGVAVVDIKDSTFSINKAGKLTVVDFDYAFVRSDRAGLNLGGPWPSTTRAEYESFLNALLRNDFLWEAGEVDGYLPAVAADQGANILLYPDLVPAPQTGTIQVLFHSAVDGKDYPKFLTTDQVRRMKLGGYEALELQRELGLPMPAVSNWTRGLRILGKGLEFAAYGVMAWEISDTLWNAAYGPETLTSYAYGMRYLPDTPEENDMREELVVEGFETTAVLNSYSADMNWLFANAQSTGCHSIELDPTYIEWQHTITPIYFCAPNPDTLQISSMETGEKSLWRISASGWERSSGNQCLQPFVGSAENGVGKIAVSSFEACVENGVLFIDPTWMK